SSPAGYALAARPLNCSPKRSTSSPTRPAPEWAHAIRVAFDEALKFKQTGEKKAIAFNLSGHRHFDVMTYEAYRQAKLEEYEYPDALVQQALTHLPRVPAMG